MGQSVVASIVYLNGKPLLLTKFQARKWSQVIS